jgi:hypothetical protein
MIYEPGHPNTTLSDWETFRREPPPLVIAEVLDRRNCDLPDCFAPLARGVAIASACILRTAGYRPGSRAPRHWIRKSREMFNLIPGPKNLVTRACRCGGQDLWTIEQWDAGRRYRDTDEALVFTFGSTPIFTRNYQSAMRLAMYCQLNGPPRGLRWINACPVAADGAIAFARRRRIDETLPRQTAQPETHPH